MNEEGRFAIREAARTVIAAAGDATASGSYGRSPNFRFPSADVGCSVACVRCSILVLAFVWSLLLPTVGRADTIKITQRLIDQEGWPRLVANYTPDGSRATASWKVCAPDCGPIVATGALFNPGPTAVGTTFEASATVDGTTTTDRSPVWGGQVTNTAPPTFQGQPRVGQTLTPHAGTWAGGWGDERSLVGMRACPTAAAEDCRAMADFRNTSEVTIDPAYAGGYVGAIESRVGSGTLFPAVLYVFPPGRVSRMPAPTPGQTVAAGALSGPILAAPNASHRHQLGDTTAPLGFTLRVTIRKRALRRGGALVLAAVRCSGRCVARATLRHGRKAFTRRIVVNDGRAAVKLWPGTFSRRATAVRVSIRFDRHPTTASGSVKLR
jgi:hypothetical protein